MPLIPLFPALGKQRHADLYELEDSQGFLVRLSQKFKKKKKRGLHKSFTSGQATFHGGEGCYFLQYHHQIYHLIHPQALIHRPEVGITVSNRMLREALGSS